MAVDDDGNQDLFMVDCGIESLQNVYLNFPSTKTLNLHSNFIPRIENLASLPSLTHLDLSSNQIGRMEGLDYLPNLKFLNLSCNLLSVVEGISKLSRLISINLSYNQIVSLAGLKHLPSNNCLQTLQLQGNSLADMSHVITHLRSCLHLTCVVFEDGQSATNPLCSSQNYRTFLKNEIRTLVSLDKPLPEVFGSEQGYQDPLISQPQSSAISTPRIDAILEKFHKALGDQNLSSAATSADATLTVDDVVPGGGAASTNPSPGGSSGYDDRVALENQLAALEKELLKKKIKATEAALQQTESSTSETRARAEDEADDRVTRDEDDFPVKEQRPRKLVKSQPRSTRASVARNTKIPQSSSNTNQRADMAQRNAVNSTYQQLIKELDSERLRRTKAEEAASKLAQQVKDVQRNANQQDLATRHCDEAMKKLQRDLSESREANLGYRDTLEKVHMKSKEMELELKRMKKTCTLQEQTIAKLEGLQQRFEEARGKTERRHADEVEKLRKALSDESELLKATQTTVKTQRTDIDNLKSLLASREADHRRDIENRYLIDSPKLEQLFESKVTSLVREHAAGRREVEYRLEKAADEYADLEDEFRLALQIEADRFQSLKAAFEELSLKQSKQETVLSNCQGKEMKTTKIVADLTQLVKEQKDKILALCKEKQDFTQNTQAIKTKLQQQVSELKGKVGDLDRLKRDNLELKNQVQGQHSIISGLRKERDLWSKELAQQGAALSSERGNLESKIETLTQENKTLQINLDREVDALRIKAKVVSDLTETVAVLKKRISQQEADYENQERQMQQMKAEHEKDVEVIRSHSASLEQEVDALVARKEELKQDLCDTKEELAKVQDSYRNLKVKWQEKSTSVAAIESQVKKMRDDFSAKEKELTDEHDAAVHAAKLAVQRLKVADDGFRKQLEAKELSHADFITELREKYELRVAEHQHKVDTVEQEMRELLLERESSKRLFEDQLKKVNEAFMTLQQGV